MHVSVKISYAVVGHYTYNIINYNEKTVHEVSKVKKVESP